MNIEEKDLKIPSLWLKTGIFALAAGGIFAILLVLSRSPYIQKVIPFRDFFHTALVVHVDLTILVWFLGFLGIIWSLHTIRRHALLSWAGLMCFALGALMITVSPFIGDPVAIINNYVPMLHSKFFIYGLVLCLIGIAIAALTVIFTPTSAYIFHGIGLDSRLTALTSAFIVLCAISSFVLAYPQIGEEYSGQAFYEQLFWGGGHILQYAYTQGMMLAWLYLTHACGVNAGIGKKATFVALIINTAVVVPMPLIYSVYPVGVAEHNYTFTQHMWYFGGVAPVISGLGILFDLIKQRSHVRFKSAEFSFFVSSAIIFAVGGFIGFMIEGSNVTVPAHYHGSIVGVTIAYMGMTYALLPELKYPQLRNKWITLQPVIYLVGQLMHIGGLAWSGGYGAARKSAEIITEREIKIAMGMMGLGGLLAIIAGIIFVVIMYKSIKRRSDSGNMAQQLH